MRECTRKKRDVSDWVRENSVVKNAVRYHEADEDRVRTFTVSGRVMLWGQQSP